MLSVFVIGVALSLLFTVFTGDTEEVMKASPITVERSYDSKQLTEGMNFHSGDSVKFSLHIGGADVTSDATWTSSNEETILVANNAGIVGQAAVAAPGTAIVSAEHAGVTHTFNINVVVPELSVECSSTPVGMAKVGEEVNWWASYPGIGVPNYLYRWHDDEGLIEPGVGISSQAAVTLEYDTPGMKIMHFATEDTHGQRAEAVCNIEILAVTE